MADEVMPSEAASREMRRALQRLCAGYGEAADEAGELARPVDERMGLALFKIDEACAAADGMRTDAARAQALVLDALVANCAELEDVFLRINLIERFVTRMLEATRALEKRAEAVARAADPVFHADSVANMFKRSFSLKLPQRGAQDTAVKWEPVDLDFSATDLLRRLELSDARELGVSITSVASVAPVAPPGDAGSDSDA